MENSFAEANINTNYPIFSYNTWKSRSNKDAPDDTNKIISSYVKKGDRYFACNACQKMKRPWPGYGLLPEWDVGIVPWAEVTIDLIGPWTVKIRGKTTQEVFALTIKDTASNLLELVQIENKTSEKVARRFHNTGLARYPDQNVW